MKSGKRIAALFILIISFYSCKKDKSPVAPQNNTSSSGNTIVKIDTGNYINAELKSIYAFAFNPAAIKSTNYYTHKSASFYITAIHKDSVSALSNLTSTGNLYSNQLQLIYNGTPGNYYAGFSSANVESSVTWSLSASNNSLFNSFTYSVPISLPTYTNQTQIPTNISKNNGITFQVSNYTNCNRIKCFINYPGQLSIFRTINVSSTQTNVSFSPSELTNFPVGSGATIELYFYKDDFIRFNNKNIRIETGRLDVFQSINIAP